jgi:hypothetical protein
LEETKIKKNNNKNNKIETLDDDVVDDENRISAFRIC